MLLKQLLLAASAAAFLVVPETSNHDESVFSALPIDVEDAKTHEIPATAFSQSLSVPCPQCRGEDTRLKLDFAVEDNSRLLLNGFELYPKADPWQGDLMAAIVKDNGNTEDRRLGYGLAVRPEGTDEDQKLEVIGIELLIIEVGDRFVEGVPPVKVKLIKALSGELLIGSVNMSKSKHHSTACSTVWCRVQSMVDHALGGFKGGFRGHGCKGMNRQGHSKGHHGKNTGFSQYGHKEEGHRHHAGHHHQFEHDGSHTWSVVKHIASYILLPVIMGITAGVGVAILTMFVGTLLMRFIRLCRGEPSEDVEEAPLYSDRKITIVEFLAAEDEKTALKEHFDQAERN